MVQGGLGWLGRTGGWLERLASRRHASLLIAGVLTLLYLPSLGVELSGDMAYMAAKFLAPDVFPFDTPWSPFSQFTMGKSADPEALAAAVGQGLLPWWTSPGFHFQLWRPLTEWTHAFDFAAFGRQAWMMHVHQLLWMFALLCVVKRVFESVFTDRALVLLSLAFFMLSANFAQTFACLDGRNTVMAAVTGLSALLLHIEAHRRSSTLCRVLSWCMFAAALLSSEFGLGASAWLFCWSLFMDRSSLLKRFLTLVPFGLIMLGWAWVYVSNGYGVANSEMYIDPVRSPALFLDALAGRLPLLLLQSFTSFPLTLFTSGKAGVPEWWFAMAFIAVLMLFWLPKLKDPAWRFLGLSALLSTLPVAAGPGGGRTLAFVSAGLVPLVVAVILDRARGLSGGGIRRVLSDVVAWPAIVMLFLGFLLIPGLSGLYLLNHHKNVSGPASRLPVEGSIANQTVVLLNPNSIIFTKDYQSMRSWSGLPLSHRFFPLGSGQTVMTVKREGQTLLISPERGFLYNPIDFFMRPKNETFVPGQVITHGELVVQIETLTADGRPQSARFSFGKTLDSTSLSLVICERGAFVPMPPLADGESQTLQPCEGNGA